MALVAHLNSGIHLVSSRMATGGVSVAKIYGSQRKLHNGGEECFAMAAKSRPLMKNVNDGNGIFAPAIVVVRNVVGKREFNQLRGKAIALHSQVLKQRQGLI